MATTTLSFSLSLDPHSPPSLPNPPHQLPSLNSTNKTNINNVSSHSIMLSYNSTSPTHSKHPYLHSSKLLSPSPASLSLSASSSHSNPTSTRDLKQERTIEEDKVNKFVHYGNVSGGLLSIKVLRDKDLESTMGLLADSYIESMTARRWFVPPAVVRYLVKQYMKERKALFPHAVVLVASLQGRVGEQVVGMVEVSFDAIGASSSPPTPPPPPGAPYLCNMTVAKDHRRYCYFLQYKYINT